ncbi:MAG TPA: hypothetical protein VNV35_11860 [Puia sp.]|jgi:hypothetical protein|nr:hypothetical protein [Puia sp.]
MSPRLTYIPATLFLIGSFLSCKKESHSSTPPAPSSVYVLGVQDGAIVYWKNGQINSVYGELGIQYSFGPSSLAASGTNVYIAGFKTATSSALYPFNPVFWLNGAATSLSDSTGSIANGFASAVALSGGDVYIAGIRGYDSQKDQVPYSSDSAVYPATGSVATVWKNGTPFTLTGYGTVGLVDSGKYANRFYEDYVNGIFVSGSDVYVSGGTTWQSAAHAEYWKNGVPVDLAGSLTYAGPNNTSGYPQSTGIYVAGSDVYVSGLQQTAGEGPVAIYWKNGSPVFLSTDSLSGSVANAVFVSGSDVYVVGWQNINNYSRAMLWKNGMATALTGNDTSSQANSVIVAGNDVYVAGVSWVAPNNYVATYWKNGSPVYLTDPSYSTIAYSIAVQ